MLKGNLIFLEFICFIDMYNIWLHLQFNENGSLCIISRSIYSSMKTAIYLVSGYIYNSTKTTIYILSSGYIYKLHNNINIAATNDVIKNEKQTNKKANKLLQQKQQ